jgi:hypothetical protein
MANQVTEGELSELFVAAVSGLKTVLVNGVTVQKGEETITTTAPAAYFAAAIAVLKNNNVTAAKDNEHLKGLRDELAARRSKAKNAINSRTLADAAEQLERDLGGMAIGFDK